MNKPKIIQIIDVVSNAIAGNRIDEDFDCRALNWCYFV